MGGKHMKKLRAEKAKVKLKKSKSLPKGQNITDTSFKVKKVVTVEQLKKADESEPVTSWNLTLKDLLLRLNHYNYTSRLNALMGIAELISKHPEILEGPSLQPTVGRLLELLSDDEHKIRITAKNLLRSVFMRLPPSALVPFYDLLNVHLCCAMTHRNPSVQHDCLRFLDVLLERAPDAIRRNFRNLLHNFTRILFGYRYGSHSETFLTKGTKQNLEKTKTEMLTRLYEVLLVVYRIAEEENRNEYLTVNGSEGGRSLRGLQDEYKRIPDISLFRKSRREDSSITDSESKDLEVQISSVVPILFDTWTELGTGRQNEGFTPESVLSESVAALLLIILKILVLLHEKVLASGDSQLHSWFISTYGAKFKKTFLSNFPYYPAMTKRNDFLSGGESVGSYSSTYLLHNLILAYLFYSFRIIKNRELENKVERYIINALLGKNSSVADILSKTLEAMMKIRAKKMDSMLSTLVKAHDEAGSPELRRKLFEIITNEALMDGKNWGAASSTLENWIKALAARLLKPRIPLYVVEAILKMTRSRAGEEVAREVEARLEEILENLAYARVEGPIDRFEGQKMIANVLYRCRSEALEEVIQRGILQRAAYPPDLASYITEIFTYKLTGLCPMSW